MKVQPMRAYDSRAAYARLPQDIANDFVGHSDCCWGRGVGRALEPLAVSK